MFGETDVPGERDIKDYTLSTTTAVSPETLFVKEYMEMKTSALKYAVFQSHTITNPN
jgi:hypothetical protein